MAIAIVLATIFVATILFAIDRIPMEVTSLVIVAVLALSGVLTVEEAFAGFSNETVIFIFCLLSMTRGLAFTGIVQLVGQKAAVLGRFGPRAFVAAMMTGVAFVSAFVSNTVTTAALVPVVSAAATRSSVPKSKVLMPLAYASMLGGTLLLFGTSTNLVMSAAMSKIGLESISVLELLPVGLPITLIGIAIVVLVGPWVLPARGEVPGAGTSARDYLTEVVVTPDSVYLNKPLSEITGGLGLRVLGLVRGGHPIDARPDEIVTHADRLVIEEDREDILKVKDVKGLEIKPDVKLSSGLKSADAELIEASVPAGSPLIGRSLKEALFSERYGLVVLAIHRRPGVQRLTKLKWLRGGYGGDSLSTMRLAVGDVLLARGARERVAEFSDGNVLTVLVGYEYQPPRYAKALLASVIFGGVLLAGTLELANFAVAGLTGVLLMIATGCMDARNAFRVDWRVLVLIGSVLALGRAMEKTGAGMLLGSKLRLSTSSVLILARTTAPET